MRVYFAEGVFFGGDLSSPQAKHFWGLFCDMFDNFIANFLVAFLVEGTKFKIMTFSLSEDKTRL